MTLVVRRTLPPRVTLLTLAEARTVGLALAAAVAAVTTGVAATAADVEIN
jgi:hypothetical protein